MSMTELITMHVLKHAKKLFHRNGIIQFFCGYSDPSRYSVLILKAVYLPVYAGVVPKLLLYVHVYHFQNMQFLVFDPCFSWPIRVFFIDKRK